MVKTQLVKESKKKKFISRKLTWYSSNRKIAAVNQKGKITGRSPGKCKIYCLAHNGIRSSVNIIVNLNPKRKASSIPVLTFHRIVDDGIKNTVYPDNQWVASASDFENQLKFIKAHGYNVITIDDFYE